MKQMSHIRLKMLRKRDMKTKKQSWDFFLQQLLFGRCRNVTGVELGMMQYPKKASGASQNLLVEIVAMSSSELAFKFNWNR